MEYTIQKLAKLAGVSVRTLHHYDRIGLLTPSRVGDNGYRYYGKPELLRLQQILFFRELRFSPEAIKTALENPGYSREDALREQHKLMVLERERLDNLIATLEKTILHNQGEHMDDEELYGGLSRAQMDKYAEEAKQRWGNTEAYKQSAQRIVRTHC